MATRWVMLHLGPGGCGHAAFRVKGQPAAGDVLRTRDFEYLDGGQPANGDPVRCGSCLRDLSLDNIQPHYLREVAA